MMKKCLGLFLLGLAVTLAGCKTAPGVMKFNNEIARANEKLATSARSFYKAISPLGLNQQADLTTAQSSYNDAVKNLKDAQAYFESFSGKSGSYSTLQGQYKEFLKVQEKIVEEYMKVMLQTAQDAKLSPAEKWAKIYPLLAKASTDENAAYKTLTDAQVAYAKEFSLEPK